MELVQNIARLGSGTGEGRQDNHPCKILHGKAILLYPTAEFLFIRVGFYPTLSYFIPPYPTLSYFFAHTMISLGGKLLKRLLHAKAPLRGTVCAAD